VQATSVSTQEGQAASKINCPGRNAAQWFPPTQVVLKVNVDGAFNGETGEATVGTIVHDHEGQPHAMTWRLVDRCREAEEAEVMSQLEGLRLVQQWPKSTPVVSEFDCANLILKVESRDLDCSILLAIIKDIKHDLVSRCACLVHKIWREGNKIVHNLAKNALKSRSSQVSSVIVPPCIQDLVLYDRTRCQSSRDFT
jgi:hypothetical protein